MFYGYIYITENLTNNKIYVGKRKGIFTPSYLGSGKIIKLALKKNGKKNFIVEVLRYANNKLEINDLEIYYIEKYRNQVGREIMYNIGNGGEEGWDTVFNHKNCKEINHLKIVKRNKTFWSKQENKDKQKKTITLTYELIPNLRKQRKIDTTLLWKNEEYRKNQELGRKKRKDAGWFKNPTEMSRRASLSHKGQKAWNKIHFDVNKAIELYIKAESVSLPSAIY